jgi:hypothetical protein
MVAMADMMTPIEGPAAWRGEDLLNSPAWRRALTAVEVAALERAASSARGAPCPGFGKAAFPVPELAPLFAWMAEQLERGPGVVRLTGLPDRTRRPEAAVLGLLRQSRNAGLSDCGRRGAGRGEGRNRHRRGADL